MTDEQNTEFETWWEKYGQYCRSGGGEYEKSFSYATWEHCTEQARSTIAAPAQELTTPNTLGGFRGGFIGTHGHAPSEQEIWNAAVRSGMNRAAPASTAAPVVPDGWNREALKLMDDVDDLLRWASCHAPAHLYKVSSGSFWKVCHMLAAAPKPDA